MNRILPILILTLITISVFGQNEKEIYKSVSDRFETDYNSDNFDAIFSNFSPEMQKALPIDRIPTSNPILA